MSEQPKLYSEASIIIATLFGGFVAGGFIMSRNYNRLGESYKEKFAFWLGAAGTALFFTVMHFLPTENWDIPKTIYYVPQIIILGLILEVTQKKQLKLHIAEEGEFESNWKAFGISLLCLAIAFVLLIATYVIFGIEP